MLLEQLEVDTSATLTGSKGSSGGKDTSWNTRFDLDLVAIDHLDIRYLTSAIGKHLLQIGGQKARSYSAPASLLRDGFISAHQTGFGTAPIVLSASQG